MPNGSKITKLGGKKVDRGKLFRVMYQVAIG